MVITSGPGVDKTTLVNSILETLKAKKQNCLFGAPTGRTVKRMNESTGLEAKTIHRLLDFIPLTLKHNRNNRLTYGGFCG